MKGILLLAIFAFTLVLSQSYDPFCVQNTTLGQCTKCIDFFYIKNKICTKVSASCETYDHTTGDCLTCVQGFTLQQGKCSGPIEGFKRIYQNGSAEPQLPPVALSTEQITTPTLPPQLPVQTAPVLASSTFSLASNFAVVGGNSTTNQQATSQGFSFNQNSTEVLGQSNQGNSRFVLSVPDFNQSNSSLNQLTTQTTTTYSQNPTQNSAQSSQSAQTHQSDNNPYGYPQGFMDPYCQQYDQNNHCSKCATRFYFNTQSGLCTPISSLCNTFNQASGDCLSCYPGYVLNSGKCNVLIQTQVDSNCRQLDSNRNCVQCYQSFVLIAGKCTPVNPQCRSVDSQGKCTECYAGYTLRNNLCETENRVNSSDLCRTFVNNICTACYGDNTPVNGVCVSSLTLCQSVDSQNNCISCYSGYSLNNGRCILVSNEGCSKLNAQGRCIQCSKGYFFQGGLCIQSNPLCQTFNQSNGNCLSCYSGYTLNGGSCIVSQHSVQADSNCASFRNGICERCSVRFVMKQGRCGPVSDYCNTYNNVTGDCTSCYSGFLLRDGYCYKTIVIPDIPSIPSNTAGATGNAQVQSQGQQGQTQVQPQVQVQTQQQTQTYQTVQQQVQQTQTQNNTIINKTQTAQQQSLQSPPTLPPVQNQSQSQLPSLPPQLPPQDNSIQTTSQINSLNISTTPSTSENIFYEWLNRNDSQPTTFPTSNTQNNLNTTNNTLDSVSTRNTSTQNSINQSHNTTQTSVILAPPSIITSIPSLSIQPVSNLRSQSLIHSGNPCLRYDSDGTTCLECSSSWTLSFGNCLLGEIKTLDINLHSN